MRKKTNNILKLDKMRYGNTDKMPLFQYLYRKTQAHPHNYIYKIMFKFAKKRQLIELSSNTNIKGGMYVGHPGAITINPNVTIGHNLNIHKGVTIGRENRGKRKGCPTIGDNVWIGINSTIVGSIKIGNDVLIAPNSFVNVDVPDHSIVLGNPCVIKHKNPATLGYINNPIDV